MNRISRRLFIFGLIGGVVGLHFCPSNLYALEPKTCDSRPPSPNQELPADFLSLGSYWANNSLAGGFQRKFTTCTHDFPERVETLAASGIYSLSNLDTQTILDDAESTPSKILAICSGINGQTLSSDGFSIDQKSCGPMQGCPPEMDGRCVLNSPPSTYLDFLQNKVYAPWDDKMKCFKCDKNANLQDQVPLIAEQGHAEFTRLFSCFDPQGPSDGGYWFAHPLLHQALLETKSILQSQGGIKITCSNQLVDAKAQTSVMDGSAQIVISQRTVRKGFLGGTEFGFDPRDGNGRNPVLAHEFMHATGVLGKARDIDNQETAQHNSSGSSDLRDKDGVFSCSDLCMATLVPVREKCERCLAYPADVTIPGSHHPKCTGLPWKDRGQVDMMQEFAKIATEAGNCLKLSPIAEQIKCRELVIQGAYPRLISKYVENPTQADPRVKAHIHSLIGPWAKLIKE